VDETEAESRFTAKQLTHANLSFVTVVDGFVVDEPPYGTGRRRSPVVSDLPLDVLSEIRKGGSESFRVVLGGDAIWDVVGSDVDASSSLDSGDLPGHGHRAAEARVVGNEVHCLDDADVRNDVDVSRLDDVGISRGLPWGARSVGVGQDQSVGASGPRIESLELGSHSMRREPRGEGFPVDEGCIDLRWRGGDDPRCGVRARHPRTLPPGRAVIRWRDPAIAGRSG
jgi:hypothetical protein